MFSKSKMEWFHERLDNNERAVFTGKSAELFTKDTQTNTFNKI